MSPDFFLFAFEIEYLKKTGKITNIGAIFHKCPFRRVNPSLDGRLVSAVFWLNIIHLSVKYY